MSILTKLTVGAVAVLGAYALRGKRRETEASAEDKKALKPGAKARAGHSTGRTAKRAASKARPRKRPQRSPRAKRAHAT